VPDVYPSVVGDGVDRHRLRFIKLPSPGASHHQIVVTVFSQPSRLAWGVACRSICEEKKASVICVKSNKHRTEFRFINNGRAPGLPLADGSKKN